MEVSSPYEHALRLAELGPYGRPVRQLDQAVRLANGTDRLADRRPPRDLLVSPVLHLLVVVRIDQLGRRIVVVGELDIRQNRVLLRL